MDGDTIALIGAVAVATVAIMVPLVRIQMTLKTLVTKDEAHQIAESKVREYDEQQRKERQAFEQGKREAMNTPAHGVRGIGDAG